MRDKGQTEARAERMADRHLSGSIHMTRFPVFAFAFALLAIALAGCVTNRGEGDATHGVAGLHSTANKVPLQDGSEAWLISCPGWANNISACIARAKMICANGYRLVDAAQASLPAAADRLLVQCSK